MIKVEITRPVLTEAEKKIRYKQIEKAIVVIARELHGKEI